MSYYPVDVEKAVRKVCKRRRLSPRTAETYVYCINRFLKWCKKDLFKLLVNPYTTKELSKKFNRSQSRIQKTLSQLKLVKSYKEVLVL